MASDKLRIIVFGAHPDDCEYVAAGVGAKWAAKVQYAEAFEICEYGRLPSKTEIRKLFPFLPPSGK